MMKSAMQLKAIIRNVSKEKFADAHMLIQTFMMECFLEIQLRCPETALLLDNTTLKQEDIVNGVRTWLCNG